MAQVTIKVDGLSAFNRALRRYAPEVRKDFNKQMRSVVAVIVSEARVLAGWSRRIPGAIVPLVQARQVGVRVVKARAPHGPLYERGSKGRPGEVRHPLFGNRNFWYSTPTRPFLDPALETKRDEVTGGMLDALDATRRKVMAL